MSLKKIAISSLLAASTISFAFARTEVTLINGITDSNYTVSYDDSDFQYAVPPSGSLYLDLVWYDDNATINVYNNTTLKGNIRVQDSHEQCSYNAEPGSFYSNANSFWWINLYNNDSYVGQVCAPIGSDLEGHVSLSVYKVNDSFQAKLWVTGLPSASVTTNF